MYDRCFCVCPEMCFTETVEINESMSTENKIIKKKPGKSSLGCKLKT